MSKGAKEVKWKAGRWYKLISIHEEVTVVYCYYHPNKDGVLVLGFNHSDGGGCLPVYDVSANTQVTLLKWIEDDEKE